MPRGTWNIEWLNHNSQRAYPLSDDATKQDTTTEFTLPDSFLLELYFPVHAGLAVQPEKFFLRSISVFSTGYNIALGYDDGTSNPPIVASVNIAKSTHVENTSYALPGSGDYDDSVGKVIIGTLLDIDDAGAGQYFFDYADGKLDPDTIRPIIRGVSSITLVQGADESKRIYGDIELVAGSNIRLTPIVVGQNQQIRIDAIQGEGLNEDCICDGDEDAIPITTINGIPPTPQGNFTLLGSNCLDITAIPNGLQLDDTCSEPCCGCKELEAITRDLERFGDAALTLKNFINRLEAEVTQMSSVVLGSRLNDQGCLEC